MARLLNPPSFGSGHNRRTAVLALMYAVVICASFYLAYELRFDFLVPTSYGAGRLAMLPVVLGIKLVALVLTRQLGTLLSYFSIPDLIRLFWAMAISTLLLWVFGARPGEVQADVHAVPRGVLLVDFLLSFGALCAGRVMLRMYRERQTNARAAAANAQHQLQRIAIIGAGDAGASLAKEFISHPGRGFRPVMFFDDNVEKHGKLVHGIPVVGRVEMLGKAEDAGLLAKAVIAMPSAPAKRVREVVALLTQHGLKVETLPAIEELASGRARASRIRPVEVQDLLGREMVDLDSTGIKHAIENKCVLVTGAGGSIGSELCRQIAALNPQRLLMVEQAEGALFLIEQELNESGLGSRAIPLVADILDHDRMDFIFSRYRPQVVFHAAAHKHVYMMERQPAEAIRNNVLGTRQLAQLAAKHRVEAFTLISTDKAINPTNVMGATKRLAEIQLMAVAAQQEDFRKPEAVTRVAGGRASEKRIVGFTTEESSTVQPMRAEANGVAAGDSEKAVAHALAGSASEFKEVLSTPLGSHSTASAPTRFVAVRFGNVLGSSGSVIPIFKRQIANGGPVTVTHPDVTRYFMTIPESVGLVLQSFLQGRGGEIFVLDMGQPVKIVDLAKQMIELSGFKVDEDIEIRFTGLKPGEKLFEELQHHTEAYTATEHPRIMRFTSNAMFSESGVQELERNLYQYDSNQLKSILKQLVPEYQPYLD